MDAPLHSNAILLPALFAAVEHSQASSATQTSGPNFILAYLVGLEVGPRVGNALYGRQMLTRGWHSGAVFGPAASAASISKLLSLSANLIEDAIGIACTQACGLMSAQFESDVKRMQHGFPARNGLFGALMAKGGYIGIKKVFERPYGGFLSQFGQGSGQEPEYLVDEITKELGTKWQADGVRVKPYSSMAATFGTIDCVKKMQEEYPERMEDFTKIESIEYEMASAAFHHGGWKAERPLTAIGAQMNCAYAGATQIVERQVLPAQFQHKKLESDAVWDLVNKTTCVEGGGGYEQKATFKFTNGEILTVEAYPHAVNPGLSNEEIVEKWRAITLGVIDDERRKKIEKLCLGLDKLVDVLELSELMAGLTKNPIP